MARALFLLLLLGACTDFATPSELSRTQVLALRVDPPALAAGERGRLSSLVAGPEGPIEIEPTWSCASPEATVLFDNGAWWLEISAGAAPQTVRVDASFATASNVLPATRTLSVLDEAAATNPTIATLWADGQAVDESGVATAVNQPVALDIDGAFDKRAIGAVTWYATVGEIEPYHLAEATLLADEPGRGFLIVVVRDGDGGINWAAVPLVVGNAP